MKTQPSRLGLVAEGNTASSSVLHFLKGSHELGPVKSVGLSAARRLSNALKAGYAVSEYKELRPASLVLVRVPDASVSTTVREIAGADLPFPSMTFVLCETWVPVDALQPLKNLGSQIGTLMTLPLARRDWFVLEGDTRATRQVKKLAERCGNRVTELLPEGKHYLFAAELLAITVPLACFQAAQHSLRASGFSGNVLTSAMEQILQKVVRDFLRGSKGKWGGALLDCSGEIGRQHLEALAAVRSDLATFIEEQIASVRRFRKPAE